MTSNNLKQRNSLCRPPKYPGQPSDYVYVSEYCRKKLATPSKRNIKRTRFRSNHRKGDVQAKDAIIAGLLIRTIEIPKFMLHAVKKMRTGYSYEDACHTWGGHVNFEKAKDIKETLISLIK